MVLQIREQLRPSEAAHGIDGFQGELALIVKRQDRQVDIAIQPAHRAHMLIVAEHPCRYLLLIAVFAGHHTNRTNLLGRMDAQQNIAHHYLFGEVIERALVTAAKRLVVRVLLVVLAQISGFTPADARFAVGQAVTLGWRGTCARDGNLPDRRIGADPYIRCRACTRIITDTLEHTRLDGIFHLPSLSVGIRPKPFDKVFVAKALVEGDKTYPLGGNKAVELCLQTLA
ncbi:hypothetical protein D9M68_628160 [compost metagenome]